MSVLISMSSVPGRQGTLNWMPFHPLCWGAGQRKLSYFACFLQSESMPWLFFFVFCEWFPNCWLLSCYMHFMCLRLSFTAFQLLPCLKLQILELVRQMTRSCLLVGLSPQVAQAFLGFRWLEHFGGHQHSFTGPGLMLWLSTSGGGQRKLNMLVCFFYQQTC